MGSHQLTIKNTFQVALMLFLFVVPEMAFSEPVIQKTLNWAIKNVQMIGLAVSIIGCVVFGILFIFQKANMTALAYLVGGLLLILGATKLVSEYGKEAGFTINEKAGIQGL